jgi:7,8-dihydroneopterin aldolase/epimerase/oxygenase
MNRRVGCSWRCRSGRGASTPAGKAALICMSNIAIVDLEVRYCVGVSDEERAQPQRLLLTVEMNAAPSSAAITDRLDQTIDYQGVADDLLGFGEHRSWKLLETLVANIADSILLKYRPQSVRVEAKKFVIPQARHVAVSITKSLGRE